MEAGGQMNDLPSVLFMCVNGLESFVMPIVRRLGEVTKVKCVLVGPKGWEGQLFDQNAYDVLWIEWANELAVSLTNTDTPVMRGKQVVMRCHSYEVLSGLFQNVKLDRLNAIVFVADHVKDIAMKLSSLRNDIRVTDALKVWTIPNGVDMERFRYEPSKQRGYDVAFVGNISHKKGFPLLLHAFRSLPKDYKLHIAGEYQDYRFKFYADHILKELEMTNRVIFYGKVDDIPGFLGDKHFIVSSSPWEGHPVNIIEGMAMGLKPVVHNFLGASDMYPHEWIWSSIEEFQSIVTIGHWMPTVYRNQVIKNGWTLDAQVKSVEEMLRSFGQFNEAVSIDTGPVKTDAEAVVEFDADLRDVVSEQKSETNGDMHPVATELSPFEKALLWVERNMITNGAHCGINIARNKRPEMIYPEVTGYLIPTLVGCDRPLIASRFAEGLLNIQNSDGGFPGPGYGESVIFDTAQVLRGLFWAVQMNLDICRGRCIDAMSRAVSYLDGELSDSGFLVRSNLASYAMPDGRRIPQAVNLYSIVPLIKAAELTGQWSPALEEKVRKAVHHYMTHRLVAFSDRNMLSHFFFYCLDAMIELEENCSWAKGFTDVARSLIMKDVQFLPKVPFLIPAFSDVTWVCSPGQAQAAICFAKLGMKRRFELAMDGMRMLQEPGGGFLGSYGVGNWYFPTSEPSWAVKFFLDACLIEKSFAFGKHNQASGKKDDQYEVQKKANCH